MAEKKNDTQNGTKSDTKSYAKSDILGNDQEQKTNEQMRTTRQKISVALEYNPGETAPKIIATGRGLLAEKIIEKAKEADVPVYENSKLANTLSKLEIGEMIPPELYNVVAEILVFVDDMDKIRGKMKKKLV